MNLNIFCVRDRATDQFGTPMFLVSAGQAIRSFADEVNRRESGNQIAAHPEDFDLYEVGSFDTSSGAFVVHVPRMISVGKDLVVKS